MMFILWRLRRSSFAFSQFPARVPPSLPDIILVSVYGSRLRLASPLAQRVRDRNWAGKTALPILALRLSLAVPANELK